MMAIISYLFQRFMEYAFSNFCAQFTAKFLLFYRLISNKYNFVPVQTFQTYFGCFAVFFRHSG